MLTNFLKLLLRSHPPGYSSDELDGIYSKVRWHTAASIFKLPNDNKFNCE